MKNSSDQKVKQIFNGKLKGLEAPVDGALWSQIQSQIGTSPVNGFLKWSVLLIFLLLIFGFGFNLFNQRTEDAKPETANAGQVEQKEGTSALDSADQTKSEANIEGSRLSDKQSVTLDEAFVKDDKKSFDIESDQSQLEYKQKNSVEYRSSISVERTGQLVDIELILARYSPLEFEYADSIEFVMEGDVFGPRAKTKQSIRIRAFGSVTFNYLNFKPNTRDDVFFDNESSSSDLSLSRIGFRPGLEVLLPLSKKLGWKSDAYMNLRQFRVSLDYIENASQSENVDFQRLSKTYAQVSFGLTSGINYQLMTISGRRIDLDFGMSFEMLLKNEVDDIDILGTPNTLFSANFGLSVYPRLANQSWVVRPFSFISLNRQGTEDPLNLTPFGFGVQFYKHR